MSSKHIIIGLLLLSVAIGLYLVFGNKTQQHEELAPETQPIVTNK